MINVTTTRELYTVVAVDADGETINRWTDLTEDAAKAIKTTMESGTASDLECHINPQERITRGQVYVELGRNGLPSPLEISFDDRYPDFLRVRVTSVDDFDAWVEAYAVRVQSRGVRHVDTIQCSGFGEWRGWDLHLSMCVRVEEPPVEAVAAAILLPDSPELPEEPFAGPSPELVAEVKREDEQIKTCGWVYDTELLVNVACVRPLGHEGGHCDIAVADDEPAVVPAAPAALDAERAELALSDEVPAEMRAALLDPSPLNIAAALIAYGADKGAAAIAAEHAAPAAISDERVEEIRQEANSRYHGDTPNEDGAWIRTLPELDRLSIPPRAFGDNAFTSFRLVDGTQFVWSRPLLEWEVSR